MGTTAPTTARNDPQRRRERGVGGAHGPAAPPTTARNDSRHRVGGGSLDTAPPLGLAEASSGAGRTARWERGRGRGSSRNRCARRISDGGSPGAALRRGVGDVPENTRAAPCGPRERQSPPGTNACPHGGTPRRCRRARPPPGGSLGTPPEPVRRRACPAGRPLATGRYKKADGLRPKTASQRRPSPSARRQRARVGTRRHKAPCARRRRRPSLAHAAGEAPAAAPTDKRRRSGGVHGPRPGTP